MGGLPNTFPAYQKVGDEAVQKKFEQAWGVALAEKPGITITEMLGAAITGKIKALYVMGENPVLSDPDQHHVEEALKATGFLVVQDMFMTETAKFAHVVLPATTYAEKDGTFTNTERRVQKIRKAVTAPGEAKADWEIIQAIANAMGAGWNYSKAEEIFNEMRTVTPSYAGITYVRIEKNGLHWPCPAVDHPGTPVLHTAKFTRGLGLMKAIPFKEPAELPDKEYPFTLTTGRVLYQFHTGTMTRKTEGLNHLAGPMVMISTEDALALGIRDGETVLVATRRGEINTPAYVTSNIGKGTIYVPFHYAEAPANRLTINAVDPVAKIPEYKVCAAKVVKIKAS
jgi:predicted molibdopterin-dependent oxidoreductase YjgC